MLVLLLLSSLWRCSCVVVVVNAAVMRAYCWENSNFSMAKKSHFNKYQTYLTDIEQAHSFWASRTNTKTDIISKKKCCCVADLIGLFLKHDFFKLSRTNPINIRHIG